ncbi:very short patch repair endonuclease [Achromobacter seleniivolatilans]|uniref:very short patch repair endonuclease n=1 Tax=Achromobacter seleniivolatilans TaxID=3047478 RepID=UPI0035292F8D
MPTIERSAIMRAVKSRGNASTEGRMVSILRGARLTGWRRHLQIVGTPDFVFPAARVAVMVHGCFWHGCPRHYRSPCDNSVYWSAKIARNIARDKLTRARLRRDGWAVLTFWEHDLKREDVVVRRLRRALGRGVTKTL